MAPYVDELRETVNTAFDNMAPETLGNTFLSRQQITLETIKN